MNSMSSCSQLTRAPADISASSATPEFLNTDAIRSNMPYPVQPFLPPVPIESFPPLPIGLPPSNPPSPAESHHLNHLSSIELPIKEHPPSKKPSPPPLFESNNLSSSVLFSTNVPAPIMYPTNYFSNAHRFMTPSPISYSNAVVPPVFPNPSQYGFPSAFHSAPVLRMNNAFAQSGFYPSIPADVSESVPNSIVPNVPTDVSSSMPTCVPPSFIPSGVKSSKICITFRNTKWNQDISTHSSISSMLKKKQLNNSKDQQKSEKVKTFHKDSSKNHEKDYKKNLNMTEKKIENLHSTFDEYNKHKKSDGQSESKRWERSSESKSREMSSEMKRERSSESMRRERSSDYMRKERSSESMRRERSSESVRRERSSESMRRERSSESMRRERFSESMRRSSESRRRERYSESRRRERSSESTRRERSSESMRRERSSESMRSERSSESMRRERSSESMRRERSNKSMCKGRSSESIRREISSEYNRKERSSEPKKRERSNESKRRERSCESKEREQSNESKRSEKSSDCKKIEKFNNSNRREKSDEPKTKGQSDEPEKNKFNESKENEKSCEYKIIDESSEYMKINKCNELMKIEEYTEAKKYEVPHEAEKSEVSSEAKKSEESIEFKESEIPRESESCINSSEFERSKKSSESVKSDKSNDSTRREDDRSKRSSSGYSSRRSSVSSTLSRVSRRKRGSSSEGYDSDKKKIKQGRMDSPKKQKDSSSERKVSPGRLKDSLKEQNNSSCEQKDCPNEQKDSRKLDSLKKLKVSPKKLKNSPRKLKDSPRKLKDSPTKLKDSPRKSKDSSKRKHSYRDENDSPRKRRDSPRRNHHSRHRSRTPENLPRLSYKAYKYLRSSTAETYYSPKIEDSKEVVAEEPLKAIHSEFKYELVDRAERVRATKPKYEPPLRKTKLRKPKSPKENSDEESSSSDSDDEKSSSDEDTAMEELERKRQHPYRLHLELWFNDPKEMNDGPLCRCSAKSRRAGIRHGIYVGEEHLPLCDPYSNNANRLHHYRITMSPLTNFRTDNPTTIIHDDNKYYFEGFSMFSHSPLPKLPNCKVIRFNYEYTILYIEEEFPTNFTVQGLELFSQYLLNEILELVDVNWKAHNDPDGCPRFHFMPRFSRELKDGGKELLANSHVLKYLLDKNKILIKESRLAKISKLPTKEWQKLADEVKGMIVTCPSMKPSSIRVDQLDRDDPDNDEFPVVVHFGVRPPQLSYAGNPSYQKAWREYVKFRHLLANKPKVTYIDRHALLRKETRLQEMRMENDLKRDVTIVVSGKNFYKTGIMSDIVQHAMLLPVLVCHLRFHQSLIHLEDKLRYKFKDRFLLQLALTHPSYRENFGTNPDHARNSLTNCGLRQPQYGDRRIHYMNTRKRGINTLINIMSRFGSQKETLSCINHNERLEFLGDAVVEFLSSIHLFYMFPELEEGGLATYRAAIVQNQHLAVLAKRLELDRFMLYAHGSDLCHDLELRHAMANCFEALMGALFLDCGIEVADRVFSTTLFIENDLLEVWQNFAPHPLQEQEPDGDRKWIDSVPILKKLAAFEKTIGIEFNHIRLLARALTHRSLGYNNLTLGSNQRLEFLGDTVLQLVASEYLYKFFPEHHEGHLSLLRSSLVNNRTQAVVCADLGMVDYAIYPYSKVELKPKDKADLLEAFLGALYVDKDLGYCRKFCEVCFFPRLQDFIMNQDWNDPKSKLQQCCLTLRSMDGGEPDIPTYKVIECKGPTNTRVYSVAVYFQGNRLAVGSGHSIQQAEMDAAANALKKSKDLFPQLRHQRRAIERSMKRKRPSKQKSSSKSTR